MITTTQEKDFIKYIDSLSCVTGDGMETDFDEFLLSNAIEWIKTNLEPDDVFDYRQLEIWADNEGFEPEQ